MQRAHKIRLFPLPEQESYFRKGCGTARFAYNWALAEVKRSLDAGLKPEGHFALKKRLNAIKREQFPWMYEVTKCAPEAALAHLGVALGSFYKSRSGKRRGRKVGFPRFKKKGRSKDSFYVSNDQFAVEAECISLPHIGKVRMAEALRYEVRKWIEERTKKDGSVYTAYCTNVQGATISRTADHWYVSIQVEVQEAPVTHKSHVRAGIDLGLKTAVVVSTGKTFVAPKPLVRHLKRLARLNRQLHRKQLGSKNRQKAALRVGRLHERIANIRRDWLHKVTTCLARRYSFIAMEDLHVAGMFKARSLARALADSGLGELGRMLAYKVPAHGGKVVQVDRFYPSSQLCRKCGRQQAMPLEARMFVCLCGHVEDRDLNASRNTLQEGTCLVG